MSIAYHFSNSFQVICCDNGEKAESSAAEITVTIQLPRRMYNNDIVWKVYIAGKCILAYPIFDIHTDRITNMNATYLCE